MVKYNVMKKKVAVLEDTVEKLELERAAAMSQAVNEEQQHKVQEALDWFAAKMSVFSKEEQEAINACAIAFAERDQIVTQDQHSRQFQVQPSRPHGVCQFHFLQDWQEA